jgi:hypothetical protein
MPSVLSNLSPEVSALFLKIARYGPPPAYAIQRLQVPQQMKANTQAIESLAPRVKALAESLCAPVSEGDVKEGSRRKVLER